MDLNIKKNSRLKSFCYKDWYFLAISFKNFKNILSEVKSNKKWMICESKVVYKFEVK